MNTDSVVARLVGEGGEKMQADADVSSVIYVDLHFPDVDMTVASDCC